MWLEFFEKLPAAAWLTIEITLVGYFAGQLIALVLGSALHLSRGLLHTLLRVYPFVFRGTPLLIQLFILYYGIAQIEWIRESVLWIAIGNATGCAMLAVTLNVGAYSSVLVLGALANVPEGQREAARALGLPRLQTLALIELPQAYRELLPSLSNEVIFALKGGALASTITLMELTGLTKTFIARTFSPFEYFAAAGLVYLAIGYIFLLAFRGLEKRWRLP